MSKISPKYFVLPVLALVVIGSLPAPADTGAATTGACGPARVSDPSVRAAFDQFDREQSAGAAKVCAIYRNSQGTISAR